MNTHSFTVKNFPGIKKIKDTIREDNGLNHVIIIHSINILWNEDNMNWDCIAIYKLSKCLVISL